MDNNQRIIYTKNCLEFLHYKCITPDDKDFKIYQGKHNNLPEMIDANFNNGFLSDWNWIMKIKSKICELKEVDEFNTHYDSAAKGFHCSILPSYKNTFDSFYTKILTNEKEAVIEAIWSFLKWYQENK